MRSRTRSREERSRELYERYHVPASGRILWDSVLANVEPGHQGTWVNYKNDDRVPLLFISGDVDHLMPPRIQQSNLKHYKSNTITEIKEFEGPHLLPSKDGWEEVADYALDWALEHAAPRACAEPAAVRRGERCADHAHRRAHGPHRVRRMASAVRPDLRPAGSHLQVRLGYQLEEDDRAGDRRRRPRTDRCGAHLARQPRRQSRRRRSRPAPVRRRRGDHHAGRVTARGRRPRARRLGVPRGWRHPTGRR